MNEQETPQTPTPQETPQTPTPQETPQTRVQRGKRLKQGGRNTREA